MNCARTASFVPASELTVSLQAGLRAMPGCQTCSTSPRRSAMIGNGARVRSVLRQNCSLKIPSLTSTPVGVSQTGHAKALAVSSKMEKPERVLNGAHAYSSSATFAPKV